MRRFISQAQSKYLVSIEVLNHEKTLFMLSKWPWRFGIRKIAKKSKFPKDCFEPVGIGGWPSISSYIIVHERVETN
jgi:hypothetical protein